MADETQTLVDSANTNSEGSAQKDTVAYESHKKAINQLKETQKQNKELADKLEKYEKALKEKEEAELKEQNKWREMYENSTKEVKKLQELNQYAKKSLEVAVKKRAFLDTLGVNIKEDYLNFVDFDGIEMDDKGSIDTETLQHVTNKFKEKYPELIPNQKPQATTEKKDNKTLPNKNANPVSLPTLDQAKSMKPEEILQLWKRQQQNK